MKQTQSYLNIILETACAEYGSALEMLAACKLSKKDTFAFGYFEHSKDEYNHTNTFLSILSKAGKNVPSTVARKYRFTSNSLFNKGYVSRKGYLIETMRLKDFIAYVYTNELLAKESFEKILNLSLNSYKDQVAIKNIMKDELRHHGFAESHFLKYYPKLQPWQLRFYRIRETLKNKFRKMYDFNLKLLGKILKPVYFMLAFLGVKIISLIDFNNFKRHGKNLMHIKANSIL